MLFRGRNHTYCGTRAGNIYEISLARINVRANATSILDSDIIDERYDSDVCGLINSLIQLDASEFQAQAEIILENLKDQGYIPLSEAVMDAAAGKILKLDSNGRLPADITGNASTSSDSALLQGKNIVGIIQELKNNTSDLDADLLDG